MDNERKQRPAWLVRGKTIRELINELKSFDNQDLPVEISLDGGITQKPISVVARSGGICLLMNCE